MGSELSIPGFGWTTMSATKTQRSVKMDPKGFAFDAGINKQRLTDLLGPTMPSDDFYEKCMQMLKDDLSPGDFQELVDSNGTSCGRSMRFDVMRISPNTSFKLHAHPNLEIIFVVKGAMHEYRFQGPNLPKDQLKDLKSCVPDLPGEKFALRRVAEGSFLINQPGSVHLSFTRDDPETVLLVLWSGLHWSEFANKVPPMLSPPLPSEVLPL